MQHSNSFKSSGFNSMKISSGYPPGVNVTRGCVFDSRLNNPRVGILEISVETLFSAGNGAVLVVVLVVSALLPVSLRIPRGRDGRLIVR